MDQDREQLHLLSIFHYVVAGLTALVALVPFFQLFLGWSMIVRGTDVAKPDPAATLFGGCFVVFATLAVLVGFGLAACLAVAGRNLARYRHHGFCLVVAAISCLFAPFGTVLGIFTLVVLLRPSVKALFGVVPPAVPDSAAP